MRMERLGLKIKCFANKPGGLSGVLVEITLTWGLALTCRYIWYNNINEICPKRSTGCSDVQLSPFGPICLDPISYEMKTLLDNKRKR